MSETKPVPNNQDPITLKDIEGVLDKLKPHKKPIKVSFMENHLLDQGTAVVMLSTEDFNDLKEIYNEKAKDMDPKA